MVFLFSWLFFFNLFTLWSESQNALLKVFRVEVIEKLSSSKKVIFIANPKEENRMDLTMWRISL